MDLKRLPSYPRREKTYAGIGSRRAPKDVLRLAVLIGEHLALKQWTLDSGGADGMDKSFEWGCDLAGGRKRVYLPSESFNGSYVDGREVLGPPLRGAYTVAEAVWNPYAERSGLPQWDALKPFTRKLLARNAHQMLGPNLNERAMFVICWTPDGAEAYADTSPETGGTGAAIRLATYAKVPVYNLARDTSRQRIESMLHLQTSH